LSVIVVIYLEMTYRKVNIIHALVMILFIIEIVILPIDHKWAKLAGATYFVLSVRNIISYHFSLPIHWPYVGKVEKDNPGYPLYYLQGYFGIILSLLFFSV